MPHTVEHPAASLVRLNKYLANAGIASRRKADEMIEAGKVRVNGKVVTSLGTRIDPSKDRVFVHEKQVAAADQSVYIVLNKPNDCITTASDERGRTTVMEYVRVKERVFPIGRLDRTTTGVLLLTNDGELAHRLMHPSHAVTKSYKVTLTKPLLPEHARRLAAGLELSDGRTAPAEVYSVPGGKNEVIGIAIHEGRNRQIHRMFETLGYEIRKLDRVAYAGITCEGLKRGQWRYLTRAELRSLEEAGGPGEDSRSAAPRRNA